MFRKDANTLGVILNKEGIRIDPKRTDKILATPMPTNLKEMQSYCGFLSSISLYTSNHLSHHHGILAELTSAKKAYEPVSYTHLTLPTTPYV